MQITEAEKSRDVNDENEEEALQGSKRKMETHMLSVMCVALFVKKH